MNRLPSTMTLRVHTQPSRVPPHLDPTRYSAALLRSASASVAGFSRAKNRSDSLRTEICFSSFFPSTIAPLFPCQACARVASRPSRCRVKRISNSIFHERARNPDDEQQNRDEEREREREAKTIFELGLKTCCPREDGIPSVIKGRGRFGVPQQQHEVV